MSTKRCEKCNELFGVDGSHVCGTKPLIISPCSEVPLTKTDTCMLEDPIVLSIIARQEVELEQLRVSNRRLRDALAAAINTLDKAREAIHNTMPFGGLY